MAIVKWHPYGVRRLQSFDDLFNRFFTGRSIAIRNLAVNPAPATWRIPLDVVQNKDELVVTASVPGTAKEDIEISVDDNVLTIRLPKLESKKVRKLEITAA